MRALLTLLLTAAICVGATAGTTAGRVVGIVDGDTLKLLVDSDDGPPSEERIRLAGIDCPERGQPWGQKAKQALSGYVFDREVQVEWEKRDRYKRVVGKVLDGERDVNLALVNEGMCWWYRKYASEQSEVDRVLYEAAQRTAREKRRGLWEQPEPVPPWDWRKR